MTKKKKKEEEKKMKEQMFRTRMLQLPARKPQRDLFIITKDIFYSIY